MSNNYEITLILKVSEDSNNYISTTYQCSTYPSLTGTSGANYIALNFTLEAESASDAYNRVITDVMAIIPDAEVVKQTVERLGGDNDVYP
jgi:hypothetical protein